MRSARIGRWAAAGLAAVLVVVPWAEAASPAAGYWAAIGRGKVAVRKSGSRPVAYEANLRFDFEGEPGAPSGSGRILEYDEIGLEVVREVPFAWTAGKGSAFALSFGSGELDAWIEERLGEGATVEPARIVAKGKVRRRGEAVSVHLRVDGEALLPGAPPRAFRATLKAR